MNPIDLTNLEVSQPSLCIPRVFFNITESRVRLAFEELGLGKLSRVDVVEKCTERGEKFKRVYIHFEKWYWNEVAQQVRKKLLSGKEIKIVYENPWFWKVSASKHYQDNGERRKLRNDYGEKEQSNCNKPILKKEKG
jgi:hypothetical protein